MVLVDGWHRWVHLHNLENIKIKCQTQTKYAAALQHCGFPSCNFLDDFSKMNMAAISENQHVEHIDDAFESLSLTSKYE